MDKESHYYTDRALVIEGNKIKKILPENSSEINTCTGTEINAEGMLVMPGFINAHMHSNLVRGFGDDAKLYKWHKEIAETVGLELTPEEAYTGALLAYMEAIRSGTTTIAAMEKYCVHCYKAALKSGIRARITPYVLDFPDCLDTVGLNTEYVRKTYRPGERVKFWFGFDSFREAGESMIKEIAALSEKYNVPMQTHCSESVDDVKLCKERFGKTPVEYLDSLGVLTNRMLLAHAVHLNEKERALVKQRGARVAHCCISNMKLCDGIAPVCDYIERGIPVGLGTDGANSNNNYDMFEEMKAAALLQRISTDRADALKACDVLRLATAGGAAVLDIENETGSLEPGKAADIILVDMRKLHFAPYDTKYASIIKSHLVFSASGADVDTSIIDGRIVMRNRKFTEIDEAKLLYDANLQGRSLIERLVKKGLRL